jgi:hypothetical protein
VIALNAVTYRNSATFGTPTWVACPEFENIVVDPRFAELGANSRASPFAMMTPGLASVSISGRLKVKPGNANYEAFMDAFALRTTIDLLILDGPNTLVGARGVRAECYLFAARDDQGIEARLYRELEIRFADGDNLPKWAKVAAGPAVQYAEPGGSFA